MTVKWVIPKNASKIIPKIQDPSYKRATEDITWVLITIEFIKRVGTNNKMQGCAKYHHFFKFFSEFYKFKNNWAWMLDSFLSYDTKIALK